MERLRKNFGSVPELVNKLGSNTGHGLSFAQMAINRTKYGTNVVPKPRLASMWELMWDAAQDETLIILMIAGVISLVLGSTLGEHKNVDWIEGVAILFAVVVVVLVGATTEKQKQKQFTELEDSQNSIKFTEVIRGGKTESVNVNEVLVGDIVKITSGAVMCADGILLNHSAGAFTTDESALTGNAISIASQSLFKHILYFNLMIS